MGILRRNHKKDERASTAFPGKTEAASHAMVRSASACSEAQTHKLKKR
jgi:hypothetical protein